MKIKFYIHIDSLVVYKMLGNRAYRMLITTKQMISSSSNLERKTLKEALKEYVQKGCSRGNVLLLSSKDNKANTSC